jgi:hypothetical protein
MVQTAIQFVEAFREWSGRLILSLLKDGHVHQVLSELWLFEQAFYNCPSLFLGEGTGGHPEYFAAALHGIHDCTGSVALSGK